MSRIQPLPAYGLNLFGSLIGIISILALSFFWTPPTVWFSVVCALAMALSFYSKRAMLIVGTSFALTLIVLGWPVAFGFERVYSPYQLLERGPGEYGAQKIRAAGQYYQRIMDLSKENQIAQPELQKKAKYYDFAYKAARRLNNVAIVGAGGGNDVAAALRAGAEHVDAVELDPAIMQFGELYHPEKPYASAKVHCVVDDARSFLHQTKNSYDMIVYALIDSHIGQESGLRIDSYVYTLQALSEARARLNPGGVLSLAFAVKSPQLEHKIYVMMTKAFDDHPPVCIHAIYDNAIIYLQSKEGDLVVPANIVEQSGFEEVTAEAAKPIETEMPTDDWPFFYMSKRAFPLSYLPFTGLVVILCAGLFASLYNERPKLNGLPFLFLGAGFMLIETKAITELGLQFGNTWSINGIVFAALMIMAFLANLLVQKYKVERALIPFIFLFVSIMSGFAITYWGGFPSTPTGKLLAVFVLVCPMFFSGIVFSSLLKKYEDISSAMFMNLLGAVLGGLLEYSAMFLGYRALYILALAIYMIALVWVMRANKRFMV